MEESQCVFCRKAIQHGRLLPCLHNVCVRCVQDKVAGNNTILCQRCGTQTKPSPSGVSQLQALPSCYNTCPSAGSGAREDRIIVCDVCAEEEEAEGVCLSCGLHLCTDHVTSHAKSRSTRGHNVQPLSEVYSAGKRVVESSSCPLHAGQQLELYCEKCTELFCKQCEALGSHSDHTDRVIAVKEAVRKLRQELREMRKASTGPPDAKAEQADGDKAVASVTQSQLHQAKQLKSSLQATKASISKLNKRTETVSAQVDTVFSQVVDTAQQRQHALLDELDAIRWKALQQLEEQHQRLRVSIAAGEQIDLLLDRCQNDLDFLRMARWLKDQMLSIGDCLEKDINPVVSSHAVLRQLNLAEFVVLAGKVGRISDEAVDETQSAMSCPSTADVKEEVRIKLQVQNSAGDNVPVEIVKEMDFSVCITPANGGGRVECELGPGSSAGVVEATFKPPAGGKYVVSATMDQRHLQGSPVVLDSGPEARPGVAFDPAQISPDIQLSNSNCTAALSSLGYGGVVCRKPGSCGCIEFRVQLDTYNSSDHGMFMAVTTIDPPVLDHEDLGDGYGWDLANEGSGYGGGMSPGSFQQGDVISVFLDYNHDQPQVEFTHERTGMGQKLRKLADGEYYLSIILCQDSYTSFDCLPPQISLVRG